MQKKIIYCAAIFTFLTLVCKAQELKVYGAVESVQIFPQYLNMMAKIDTGARMSSLDARGIKVYDKDGVPWVTFTVYDRVTKQHVQMNKRVLSYAEVKARARGDQFQEPFIRPVIQLKICIGDQLKSIQVNLANRRIFAYPLLLGMNAIKKYNMVIDPKLKNTTEPNCKQS